MPISQAIWLNEVGLIQNIEIILNVVVNMEESTVFSQTSVKMLWIKAAVGSVILVTQSIERGDKMINRLGWISVEWLILSLYVNDIKELTELPVIALGRKF